MRKFKLVKDLPGILAGTILVEKVAFPGTSELLIDGYTEERAGLILRKEEEFGEALSIGGVHYATADVENWLEEIKTEPDYKRWRAEVNEIYFFLYSDTSVLSAIEGGDPIDDDRYNIGNYFQTKEEAQALADYLKALAVVRDDAKGFVPDWLDGGQAKVYIGYSHYQEGLSIGEAWYDEDTGVFGLPYFATKEDAKASIKKHRKEWETIFGIKDEEEE